MPDDIKLLMQLGHRAYSEYLGRKIEMKVQGRVSELQLELLEIEIREKFKQVIKSAKKAEKESR
jgi:hypothetical protein